MSNAMRTGKRTLAGVAAGALALGMLTVAGTTSANAAPSAKPKSVDSLTATTPTTAASAYQTPSNGGTLTNLMNLIAVTGDDTFATSGDDSIVSIRLDSAPADDTGTGFAAIQLSADDTTVGNRPRVGTAIALNAAGTSVAAPTVGIPNNYVWTRGSVVTMTNNNSATRTMILRGTAPNAGNYGFTVWVNKTGGNPNVLDPGEPFTTGTLTVGGTPSAFTVTPPTASVGAAQNATFRVTATDSAGRATFPTGVGLSSGSWANVTSNPSGVTFTPAGGSGALTATLGAAQFINIAAPTIPQGSAQFTASSVTGGNYAITVGPGGTLPGTVTAGSATLTVAPVVAVASGLVTAPATATTSNTQYTAPVTVLTGANQTVYLPTTATSATFRISAVTGSTPGQLVPYSVTNDSGNAAGTGVTSGAFTAAIDSNLRASVTVTATAPVAGTKYTVVLGQTNTVTFNVEYAAPALNILNLTTAPPRGSTSYVKTATATAIAASVTDQFNQPLQNITVTSAPSVSAASSAVTDAKGVATISIAAPAATVTSQTVRFTLTAPLGSPTPASSALTLLYTASGAPTSLTLSTTAGNVAATALATQNVDTSGANAGSWTANGGTGWMQVNATVGGGVTGVPVNFTAPDTYFTNSSGGTNIRLADKDASVGVVTQAGGVASVWVKPTKTGTVTVTANAGGLEQTVTWKVANAPTDARVLTVTPEKQDASGLAQVTALVKDAYGNTVANVSLNFSETGVGNFASGSSTLNTFTGPTGAVTVDVLSVTAGDSAVAVNAVNADNFGGAAGSPLATSPAGVSSGAAAIKFGAVKGITITGSRTTVSGKSGIKVEGVTTGIANGQTVTPFIRFPGETTFTAGSARPVITDGKFTWERKTGKRVTVYVSHDGLNSNRVTIQAN